ncbi:MAG: hypothetical protein CVU06_16010, partial [Bacteroidetes bacterium HGW-Bacteroidetes-22]
KAKIIEDFEEVLETNLIWDDQAKEYKVSHINWMSHVTEEEIKKCHQKHKRHIKRISLSLWHLSEADFNLNVDRSEHEQVFGRWYKKGSGTIKESAAEEPVVTIPELRNSFSQKLLESAWNEIVASTPHDPVVYYLAISSYTPVLREDFVIEQRVENKMMEEALIEKRPELYTLLRQRLNNNVLRIQVVVSPSAEKAKVYTPMEKYNLMAEINPALNELRTQLDLEIEG